MQPGRWGAWAAKKRIDRWSKPWRSIPTNLVGEEIRIVLAGMGALKSSKVIIFSREVRGMLPTKIVIIGAGSASFGLNTLAALMGSQQLHGSHLALVDRNPHTLGLVERLARRLNGEWGAQMAISTHTHHAQALEGAGFVVLSIEVPPREALWRKDYEITLKYGLRQPYAENGGPGGFAHAARNIGPVMDIVRQMEALCPDAWLINFTNPIARICNTVARYSKIKVVGLCHQILVGYTLVGMALATTWGSMCRRGLRAAMPARMKSPLRRKVARQAVERLDIRAAGLNHFTWMLSVHDRKTGEDLYPLFPGVGQPCRRISSRSPGEYMMPLAGSPSLAMSTCANICPG